MAMFGMLYHDRNKYWFDFSSVQNGQIKKIKASLHQHKRIPMPVVLALNRRVRLKKTQRWEEHSDIVFK